VEPGNKSRSGRLIHFLSTTLARGVVVAIAAEYCSSSHQLFFTRSLDWAGLGHFLLSSKLQSRLIFLIARFGPVDCKDIFAYIIEVDFNNEHAT